MRKYVWIGLTALMIIVCQQKVQAQYYLDGHGGIIKSSNDVDGSYYLFPQWNAGTATNAAGKIFTNMRLKYDIIDDIPVFAGDHDEIMAFAEKMKIFTIDHITFACGFPAVDTLGTKNYYQVLTSGKAILLKHYTKQVEKSKPYGSAVVTIAYSNYESWYILKDGKMNRIKPSVKSIIDALSDKKDKMLAFAKDNKDLKTDAQLGLLVTYYNSL